MGAKGRKRSNGVRRARAEQAERKARAAGDPARAIDPEAVAAVMQGAHYAQRLRRSFTHRRS